MHASKVAGVWAAAGLDVTVRTSSAAGHPAYSFRDGYRVIRKSGRYAVFPRAALSGLLGRTGPRDGLVEVWNGMPFFSPLWARSPRVVVLHHVHADMWRMVIKPAALARVGELIEFRLAPPVYRRSRIVTLSESSRTEIVELLGMDPALVDVVPPGVDEQFSPGGSRSRRPLVVAVGRLVPVKRFDRLVETLVELRRSHRDLRAVIVGEGYGRELIESQIRAAGAGEWLSLPGRLSDADLVELYRQAWVLTSASAREGWGMTITEAGACGTPAVVSDIAGHRDAVAHGVSGLLSDDIGRDLDLVLRDASRRDALGAGAATRAAALSWEMTARGTLEALAAEALAGRPFPSRAGR